MGKRAEQNKKRKRSQPTKPHLPTPPSRSSASPIPTTLISEDDLETAVYVLNTLSENPEELGGKEMKFLKRGVHDLYRVMVEGSTIGSSLTSKVSAALSDYRFTDAYIHLFEMYTRALPPKLGALQRWVRECDATSGADGEGADEMAMKCLDMILRIAGGVSSGGAEGSGKQGNVGVEHGGRENVKGKGKEIVRRHPVWSARGEVEGEIKIWEMMKDNRLFESPPPSPYPNFKPVHHLPGPLRKPPNKYPSTVYASSPSAITLAPVSQRRKPEKHDVPEVKGAFLVTDVFTPEECVEIVRAAEGCGFELDEAAEGSARLKSSILARNFVWLADQPFLSHFYSQILPFVPQTAPVNSDGNGGGKVRGINARFRVYQYTENQVYRPHIDGAWPAAGLHPETGEYLHDSSPATDPLWSRYTLLVYLNGDIPDDTGCTTFFLPSDEIGVMEATRVKPIQGAVLCFPHGDTQGSLLHEGSAVGNGGGKLVIRTDLLYEAAGYGEFKPPPSVAIQAGGRGEEGIGG